MGSVSLSELTRRTSAIIRRVREDGETFEVTYRGRVIAHVVPVEFNRRSPADERAAWWVEWDNLAAKIGAEWPTGVTGTDAVDEDRSEF